MPQQAQAGDPTMRPAWGQPVKTWPRRLGWLILIWIASVLALAMVAGLFRILMNAAGLTT